MKINRPASKQPMPPDAKLVFKGKIFDVYQWQQQMYDGSFSTFERLKRADTVILIPVTENKEIIIINEEQPGKSSSINFPGGRLEPGEDITVGAKRELEEETGYSTDDFILLKAMHPLTKIDWVVYYLIAKNCKKTKEQHLDAGEKIKLKLISFEEMINLLIRGDMESEPELTNIALRARIFPEEMKNLKDKILF